MDEGVFPSTILVKGLDSITYCRIIAFLLSPVMRWDWKIPVTLCVRPFSLTNASIDGLFGNLWICGREGLLHDP